MTISVTQLGNFLKGLLDSEVLLFDLKVEGEISNCRQSSEVVFFVLKDQNAQIDCFCYNPPKTKLCDGQQVVVSGRPNFYVKGGKLSFYVTKIEAKDQIGDKFKQFLLLKEKLENMGYFNPLRKKPINTNCKKIGVISSSEGAVIKDILNVSQRRNPTVDLILYDSRVQGVNSEQTIIRGLKYFENTDVDNVIIARGGGSSEDLSSFNTEALVYAIADCKKPIISAVGHETDFTLCDFVADYRASTPSVAAEICTQNVQGMLDDLTNRLKSQSVYISSFIKSKSENITNAKRRLLAQMNLMLQTNQNKIDFAKQSLLSQTKFVLTCKQNQLQNALQRLDDNSPAKILQKGFSLVQKDEKPVSAKNLNKDDKIKVTFNDGCVCAVVEKVEVK